MRKIWTNEEKAILRELYPDTRTEALAQRFDCTIPQIYGLANRLGLKKSAAFLASPDACRLRRDGDNHPGAAYRFKPGHKTWNKGMKGLDIGGKQTRFKPSLMPHNHVPVGTMVMSSDGYLKIKVAEPKMWKQLHRKNWEDANGPIPANMLLVFKNNNHEDCTLENLELITRQENMRRNTVHNYPEEIKQVIQIRAGFVRRINHKERHNEQ